MGSNLKGRNFKLTYFDVKALGEPIRWIFHYHQIPFEDVRIPWDYPTWFESTKKDFTDTVGQIPVLELDNGKKLCQSHVISRYLATEFNFSGDTSLENALVDEVISLTFDLFIWWRMKWFMGNQEAREYFAKAINQKFPLFYARFNKILEESNGDFVLGEKLTHADFWLASFIDVFEGPMGDKYLPIMPWGLPKPAAEDFLTGLVEKYPKLLEHKNRVMNLPGIREWVAKRPNSAA